MDAGEYAVLALDFSGDPTHRAWDPSIPEDLRNLQATTVLVGKPAGGSGVEYLASFRIARYGIGEARLPPAFGSAVPGVALTLHNYVPTALTDPASRDVGGAIGPSPEQPHLEFSIARFSFLPLSLGVNWDFNAACVGVYLGLGSFDDGPIGDDDTPTAQHSDCPPSASPTVSGTASSSASSSSSATSTPSSTPSSTGSVPPITCTDGLVAVPNPRPGFVRAVFPSPSRDAVEVRLCSHDRSDIVNVGVTTLTIETGVLDPHTGHGTWVHTGTCSWVCRGVHPVLCHVHAVRCVAARTARTLGSYRRAACRVNFESEPFGMMRDVLFVPLRNQWRTSRRLTCGRTGACSATSVTTGRSAPALARWAPV